MVKLADYTNYEELQSSNKSIVTKALDKYGNKVLLKSFVKSYDNMYSFTIDPHQNKLIPTELFFLSKLTGEAYVPKLLGYHDEDHFATVKMEFFDNQWLDLLDLSEKEDLNENKLKVIFKNIMSALHKMGEKGYYHCDIKPENIMVHEK